MTKPATTPAPKADTKAPSATSTSKTITLVAPANPKKAGSASAARFALYTSGMTVAAYVEACIKAGQSRRNATADIAWDSSAKRGFITVA